jgi:hypothetical protein
MNEAILDLWLIVIASVVLGVETHWWVGLTAFLFGMAFKPTRMKEW